MTIALVAYVLPHTNESFLKASVESRSWTKWCGSSSKNFELIRPCERLPSRFQQMLGVLGSPESQSKRISRWDSPTFPRFSRLVGAPLPFNGNHDSSCNTRQRSEERRKTSNEKDANHILILHCNSWSAGQSASPRNWMRSCSAERI